MRSLFLPVLTLLALSACNSDQFLAPDSRMFNQMDRIGRPAINTVFIPSGAKQAFNQDEPADDRSRYTTDLVNFLTTVAGMTTAEAEGLAAALLPDILTIDTSAPSVFLNGRGLADDVITAELGLIFRSNQALNDDNVDANDTAFLSAFPYLAAPFQS